VQPFVAKNAQNNVLEVSQDWKEMNRDFATVLSEYFEGVRMSEPVHQLLGGERIKAPSSCAHPGEGWTETLVDALRGSALLPLAIAGECKRLNDWAAVMDRPYLLLR
jgi:hypothetical protein